ATTSAVRVRAQAVVAPGAGVVLAVSGAGSGAGGRSDRISVQATASVRAPASRPRKAAVAHRRISNRGEHVGMTTPRWVRFVAFLESSMRRSHSKQSSRF
ncbi:MAG: hypothetical protein KDF67_21425, partial [Ottowia sp.]|nr:hypothetical protein [Ottowia sp.]